MASRASRTGQIGRRPSTTKDRISEVGLTLFATRGFDDTSIDDIADAAGIARRTFFRYFPSKNALPWGDFDVHLGQMRRDLLEIPIGTPLADALTTALVDFNTVPDEQRRMHRTRMKLILTVPALQGYSMVMYEDWRRVVAQFVSGRTGIPANEHGPRTIAWLMLGIAISAYEQWLADEDSRRLHDLIAAGARALHEGVDGLV